jgi:hypothetical protein
MYLENLKPKCITDFTTEDTIYMQKPSKDKQNNVTYLCQFVEYKGNKVIGRAIESTMNKDVHQYEINNGLEISTHIEKCALYGENPIDNRKYFHWFMSSGYAIYPTDYSKESENAKIINKHPSFGMVGITRRNARGSVMFGSSITHNEVIGITIKNGSVERKLNTEWYYGEGQLIEIELSASQFAEFITTPNCGDGVPCTIRQFNGDVMPKPPYENRKDLFSKEFQNDMNNIKSDLNTTLDIAKNILQKPNIGKGDKEELIALFDKFINKVSSSIPFIETKFVEQMDRTVTEAKGEIEAFINRRLTEEGRNVLLGENGENKIIQ